MDLGRLSPAGDASRDAYPKCLVHVKETASNGVGKEKTQFGSEVRGNSKMRMSLSSTQIDDRRRKLVVGRDSCSEEDHRQEARADHLAMARSVGAWLDPARNTGLLERCRTRTEGERD